MPREQGGGEATVIAWIWARTVKCPNPTCGCEMPLASSFVLSKKKRKEAWVQPIPDNKHVRFKVQKGKCPQEYESYKTGRGATFKCPCCGEITSDEYVKLEGEDGKIGSQLMAIVAEGKRGRIYLSPNEEHILAAKTDSPEDGPSGILPDNPRWFSPPAFGMSHYEELFTSRQLTALTTFSALVAEAQKKVEADAAAGVPDDHLPLREGGDGARAYGEAVGVYLAFVVDKLADLCNALTGYLKELLINYQELDGNNFNARISILYAGILFLNNQKELPEYCRKGTTYLFNETKLNLPLDLRETIIFEHLFSLAVNYFLS